METKPILSLSSSVKLESRSYVMGDEAIVVLVELCLTRKAEIRDRDEVTVVLLRPV